MAKQPTASMSCLKDAPLDQSLLFATVVKNVNANPAKLGASPYTDDEAEAIQAEFNLKYSNRLNGANARSQFTLAQKDMKEHLREMAHIVNIAAFNKPHAIELITLSGFKPTDTTDHPAPMPEQPIVTLIAHPGRNIEVRLKHTGHRESYVLVWSENVAPTAEVSGDHISVSSTAPVFMITNGHQHEDLQLSPNADKVYVFALAQNATGKSPFSPMASTKVLE